MVSNPLVLPDDSGSFFPHPIVLLYTQITTATSQNRPELEKNFPYELKSLYNMAAVMSFDDCMDFSIKPLVFVFVEE